MGRRRPIASRAEDVIEELLVDRGPVRPHRRLPPRAERVSRRDRITVRID